MLTIAIPTLNFDEFVDPLRIRIVVFVVRMQLITTIRVFVRFRHRFRHSPMHQHHPLAQMSLYIRAFLLSLNVNFFPIFAKLYLSYVQGDWGISTPRLPRHAPHHCHGHRASIISSSRFAWFSSTRQTQFIR